MTEIEDMRSAFMNGDQEAKREVVGEVEATDLDNAWEQSQNDFGVIYRTFGKRSTMIGDVIEDIETGERFMIEGIGFSQI